MRTLTFPKVNIKKLLAATVILFSVACASMYGAFWSYIYGAQSYHDYMFAITAPFYAGFVLIGFFGLMYVYRYRRSSQCLYGFLITIFCYGGIEIMYKATGA